MGTGCIEEKHLSVPQRVQRMIDIKIAKAYRTIYFEASCMLAGVPPIGIVIEGEGRLYEHECHILCQLRNGLIPHSV